MQIWGMYRKWAQKRKMQSSVLVEKLDGEDSFKAILEVSGFGAYTLLENEKGRHVLEDLKDHKTTVQCTLLVNVVPQQDMDGADRYDLLSQAKEAFNTVEARQEIIRRYRFEPSPLVRDNVKQWRTGHLDRVLEGDFDLIV